jgi:flagellar biosynthetic protein FliQ
MSDVEIMEILQMMAMTAAKIAGPLLAATLTVGVTASIVQTVTQIQEQSVVFVAKFAAVIGVLVVAGPWMLGEVRTLIETLWARIPEVR